MSTGFRIRFHLAVFERENRKTGNQIKFCQIEPLDNGVSQYCEKHTWQILKFSLSQHIQNVQFHTHREQIS